MKSKCWKCSQENERKEDGYCWCSRCRNWYAPIIKEESLKEFLDEEESKQ